MYIYLRWVLCISYWALLLEHFGVAADHVEELLPLCPRTVHNLEITFIRKPWQQNV